MSAVRLMHERELLVWRSGAWKLLRDKCLRVPTFYRVMHMRERSRKAACMRRLRRLFSGTMGGELSCTHTARGDAGCAWGAGSGGPHWTAGARLYKREYEDADDGA